MKEKRNAAGHGNHGGVARRKLTKALDAPVWGLERREG